MPIKAAIVAKHEFIEIGIDVLAAQSMISAEAPSLHQRKCPMDPGQNDVRGHLADDARIVPIAFQARKGFVAIREQRGSSLHVGVDERFDRRGGIVGDHGEANATGTRVEIFGVLAARLGLVGVAFDHLDGAYDEDFSRVAAFEESVAFPEGDFRLIDFDHAFQRLAIWIDHRAPELLRQQPGGLVGDAKLVFSCSADMPLEWVVMRWAAQNHVVRGNLERCIAVPAVTEVCRPQSRHSYKRGRLFSAATRRLPQAGQKSHQASAAGTETAAQLASSGNAFWNCASERALAIEMRPGGRAMLPSRHYM